ncbi:DUF6525 family protein [Defluviimonas denitrificans]|jgi:hypothetical protein|uniref:DUF6525 family protein n=1 Tax=Albidovulum denitrificans TaxID=404881 RepID=UPI002481AF61|nr:DUF6525 family protein [Defluviimonas denitrificans]
MKGYAGGRRNARSTLKGRRQAGDPMAAYDLLPPDLRHWLAQAVLPWSARSALRAWRRALLVCNDDAAEARCHLNRIERKQLSRDIIRVWGEQHPDVAGVGRAKPSQRPGPHGGLSARRKTER